MSTIMFQISIFIFRLFGLIMCGIAVFCLFKRKSLTLLSTSNESSEDAENQDDVAQKRFHLAVGAFASFAASVICFADAASLINALETIAQS